MATKKNGVGGQMVPVQSEIVAMQADEGARMIELAITSGAQVEQLERLIALKERFDAAQSRKAYTTAMTRFKELCPPVLDKDATVDFTSAKGRTNYRHASLDGIMEVVTPYLSACGLSVAWPPEHDPAGLPGWVRVTCVITHIEGHSERFSMAGPYDATGNKNGLQQIGSAVKYLQRYTVLAALGLATGERDNDGNAPPRAAEALVEKINAAPQAAGAKPTANGEIARKKGLVAAIEAGIAEGVWGPSRMSWQEVVARYTGHEPDAAHPLAGEALDKLELEVVEDLTAVRLGKPIIHAMPF